MMAAYVHDWKRVIIKSPLVISILTLSCSLRQEWEEFYESPGILLPVVKRPFVRVSSKWFRVTVVWLHKECARILLSYVTEYK
jgi:hypothetical protein